MAAGVDPAARAADAAARGGTAGLERAPGARALSPPRPRRRHDSLDRRDARHRSLARDDHAGRPRLSRERGNTRGRRLRRRRRRLRQASFGDISAHHAAPSPRALRRGRRLHGHRAVGHDAVADGSKRRTPSRRHRRSRQRLGVHRHGSGRNASGRAHGRSARRARAGVRRRPSRRRATPGDRADRRRACARRGELGNRPAWTARARQRFCRHSSATMAK